MSDRAPDTLAAPEAAPVSLYLDLEDGRKPDLEVVARASLAFAAAIRETAHITDPSIAVRVELHSGTDGSLSLNTAIRAVQTAGARAVTRESLIAVATTAATWFTLETGRWSYEKILDHAAGMHEGARLSETELDRIAVRVTENIEKRTAHRKVEGVYHELEADPAIRGVGVPKLPGTRPEIIVPRSEFSRRAVGMEFVESAEIVKRTRRTHERVTLIRPVLVAGPRRWQFSGIEGQFGASIKDQTFLDNLLNGHIAVPMVAGIQLDIDLDTTEEKQNDVWVIVDRTITRVGEIHPPAIQGTLPLPPPRESQPQQKDTDDEEKC